MPKDQGYMSQENFWILISKKLAGEASPEELSALADLIDKHPEWQYALQNLEDLWRQRNETPTQEDEDAYLLHLQRMKENHLFENETETNPTDAYFFVNEVNRPRRIRWMLAAALVFGIALSGFFWLRQSREHDQLAQASLPGSGTDKSVISTRLGSKSKIQLPDGSTVWLNAGSKLTYDKQFGKTLREVELTGEGYFDVVKDPEHPFVIHTQRIDIRVLGTVFNVKAYPEDKTTETSLIRGSVEVSVKDRPNDKIILSPHEKLVVENKPDSPIEKIAASKPNIQPAISIKPLQYNIEDSTVAETLWVDNRLVFREESFSELAKRMERWYNVFIEIRDPELNSVKLSGIFSDETVEQALQALMFTTPFRYEIKGDRIFIYK